MTAWQPNDCSKGDGVNPTKKVVSEILRKFISMRHIDLLYLGDELPDKEKNPKRYVASLNHATFRNLWENRLEVKVHIF